MASQNEKVVYRKLFCWLTISNFLYIIVLLILAAISIATLTGENGILTKASTAARETKRQEIIENAKLDIFEYEAENEGKITDEKALEIIAKYDKNYTEGIEFNFNTNENGEEYFTTEDEQKILVSEIWKLPRKYKIYNRWSGICSKRREHMERLVNEL